MRIVRGEGLLVHRQLRDHELLQRDEIGPGLDQRPGGRRRITVLVADIVLHDDELPPAAFRTGQEQPAEEMHPDAHGQQHRHQGDGGPPHEGGDEQQENEDAHPRQKGLQQTPHPPDRIGHTPVERHHPGQHHGQRGENTPVRPTPGSPSRNFSCLSSLSCHRGLPLVHLLIRHDVPSCSASFPRTGCRANQF